MKTLCTMAHALMILLFAAACADTKEQREKQENSVVEPDQFMGQERHDIRKNMGTITQKVDDNKALKILQDALRTTGLDSQLMEGGPYTLFAPSDEAFEAISIDYRKFDDSLSKEALKEILLHHVAEGNFSEADLVNMRSVPTLSGDSLQISSGNNTVKVDSASVIYVDEADNGYVHVINEMLLPENDGM